MVVIATMLGLSLLLIDLLRGLFHIDVINSYASAAHNLHALGSLDHKWSYLWT